MGQVLTFGCGGVVEYCYHFITGSFLAIRVYFNIRLDAVLSFCFKGQINTVLTSKR